MSLPPIEFDERNFSGDGLDLPPMPEVLSRLMEAMREGDTDARQIAKMLSSDSRLVADCLRVVNSAYYSLPRRITDITHAVAYLGIGEIFRIVLVASVRRSFEPEDSAALSAYWTHAFHTGLTTKTVLKHYERTLDPGETYTAAILHDLGKLVYMRLYPDHYSALVAQADERGTFLFEAERELGTPSHGTLGAALCRRWGMPALFASVCERHEIDVLEAAGPEGAAPPTHRAVAVANLLSLISADVLSESVARRAKDVVSSTLGFDEDAFLVLMGDVYDHANEIERFLDGA